MLLQLHGIQVPTKALPQTRVQLDASSHSSAAGAGTSIQEPITPTAAPGPAQPAGCPEPGCASPTVHSRLRQQRKSRRAMAMKRVRPAGPEALQDAQQQQQSSLLAPGQSFDGEALLSSSPESPAASFLASNASQRIFARNATCGTVASVHYFSNAEDLPSAMDAEGGPLPGLEVQPPSSPDLDEAEAESISATAAPAPASAAGPFVGSATALGGLAAGAGECLGTRRHGVSCADMQRAVRTILVEIGENPDREVGALYLWPPLACFALGAGLVDCMHSPVACYHSRFCSACQLAPAASA